MAAKPLSHAEALKAAPGDVLRCALVDGLELYCRATKKAWVLRYRAAGIRRAPVLGYFPGMRIEDAREAARALLVQIAQGRDPSAEKQALRNAATVAELGELYIKRKAETNKPRTMEEIERHIRRQICPEIGTVRVCDVSIADVERVLRTVRERKHTAAAWQRDRAEAPGAANRVRETLRGMLNFAETQAGGRLRPPGSNPITETRKDRERKRKVHATPDDLQRIGPALYSLASTHPAHVAALLTILFAGTRVTELLTTERHEYANGVITKAEHKTDRTGSDRVIYLPKQAVAILDKLPRTSSPYLFGGIDRYAVFAVWDKARTACGCNPDLTVRDFRRTFASIAMSRAGVSLEQIGDLFSHGDVDTTKGYAWLMDDSARDAAQRTADEIQKLMDGPKPRV